MEIFSKGSIDLYFKERLQGTKNLIEKISESTLMSSDPIILRDGKVERTLLNHLVINLDERESSVKMVNLLGSQFPRNYDVESHEIYPRARVSYYYSLPKHSYLLNYKPTDFYLTNSIYKSVKISITQDKFVIHCQTFDGNEIISDIVKQDVKNTMIALHEDLLKTISAINRDIDRFNAGLSDEIDEAIIERKKKIIARNQQNDDLNDF